jgi:hypothetical protein
MPGLMHGMSALHIVEPRASLAQFDAACEVGPSYRLRPINESLLQRLNKRSGRAPKPPLSPRPAPGLALRSQ